MNTSLAIILLLALAFSYLFRKMRLPALTGMLLLGVVLGPPILKFIDPKLLEISDELKQIALVIILLRAGLTLKFKDLKRVGRPALLMSFIPAVFEISAVMALAPYMFGSTLVEAAIIGTVLAAVSPAVIVPKMIELTKLKRGTGAGVPQMIMASGTIDDIFVITLFSAAIGLSMGEVVSSATLLNIPLSIATGIGVGVLCGCMLGWFFKQFHLRDTVKIIVIVSVSLLLLSIENALKNMIPMSALLAIMTIGITVLTIHAHLADRLSAKSTKLWIIAEILLFVLIGAQLDIHLAISGVKFFIPFIALALVARMLGVMICLLGTHFTIKERIFCMFAYIPKATVQAAIGGIPLAMGLDCGKVVLTIAVLSILITAPLGAFAIDLGQKYLLQDETKNKQ